MNERKTPEATVTVIIIIIIMLLRHCRHLRVRHIIAPRSHSVLPVHHRVWHLHGPQHRSLNNDCSTSSNGQYSSNSSSSSGGGGSDDISGDNGGNTDNSSSNSYSSQHSSADSNEAQSSSSLMRDGIANHLHGYRSSSSSSRTHVARSRQVAADAASDGNGGGAGMLLLDRLWNLALVVCAMLLAVSVVLVMEPPTKHVVLHVSGSSMEPTFHHGDWLIVRRPDGKSNGGRSGGGGGFRSISDRVQRGDVVVVRSIGDPNVRMVKRVVALEGDSVMKRRDRRLKGNGKGSAEIVVPYGHVWLEGDNSSTSSDSNRYGTFPLGLLVGRVERVVRFGSQFTPLFVQTERVERGDTRAIVDFEGRVTQSDKLH